MEVKYTVKRIGLKQTVIILRSVFETTWDSSPHGSVPSVVPKGNNHVVRKYSLEKLKSLLSEIVKIDHFIGHPHVIEQLGYSTVHHGRSAHVVLNLLGLLVVPQVVII